MIPKRAASFCDIINCAMTQYHEFLLERLISTMIVRKNIVQYAEHYTYRLSEISHLYIFIHPYNDCFSFPINTENKYSRNHFSNRKQKFHSI